MSKSAAPGRRLFVAVGLPDLVRRHLAAAVESIRAVGPAAAGIGPDPTRIRWGHPDSWHLTLVFCGTVAPDQETLLVDALGPAAARHAPLRLGISGGGRFGHRVLWAGIAGDRSALVALAHSVAKAARTAGIAVERRPYRPHLTVARGAPGADLRPAAGPLSDYTGPTWEVDRLLLVESQLGAGPGGSARHTTVDSFPLG